MVFYGYLYHGHIFAGLAWKNPANKTHLKKTTCKWTFLGFIRIFLFLPFFTLQKNNVSYQQYWFLGSLQH